MGNRNVIWILKQSNGRPQRFIIFRFRYRMFSYPFTRCPRGNGRTVRPVAGRGTVPRLNCRKPLFRFQRNEFTILIRPRRLAARGLPSLSVWRCSNSLEIFYLSSMYTHTLSFKTGCLKVKRGLRCFYCACDKKTRPNIPSRGCEAMKLLKHRRARQYFKQRINSWNHTFAGVKTPSLGLKTATDLRVREFSRGVTGGVF